MRHRHGRVMPEKDAPLDTRREPALLVVEDEDKAADDEDASTLASRPAANENVNGKRRLVGDPSFSV